MMSRFPEHTGRPEAGGYATYKRLGVAYALVLTGLVMGCGKGPVCTRSLADMLDDDVINLTQWTVEQGGNGHFYGVIARELYRDQVGRLVSSYSVEPCVAHLATVTSEEENAFILNHVVAGTDQPSVLDAFWLDAGCVRSTWFWSTGESFSYMNWAPGEPSHGAETAMTMWGPSNVEYHRRPGTWNDAPPDSTVNLLAKFWAVVEFE